MGIVSMMKDFTGWTSSHGIPQIGGSTNLVVRLIWTAVFLSALGFLCYQVYVIIGKYLTYPTAVAISLKFQQRDFPVVTVCSINAYKMDAVLNSPELEALVMNFTSAVSDPENGNFVDEYGYKNMNTSIRVQNKVEENIVYIAGQIPSATLDLLTYTFDDLIMECSYMNEPCYEGNFKRILDPVYGSCFQFNNEDPAVYTNDRSGPDSGLKLLLRIPQSNLMKTTAVGGAKNSQSSPPLHRLATLRCAVELIGHFVHSCQQVAISKQKLEPFPDAFGYNAAVGYLNTYALKMTEMMRIDVPYGNCTEEAGERDFYYTSDYSQEACLRSCYQKKIITNCACGDPFIAVPQGTPKCTLAQRNNCVDMYSKAQTENADNIIGDCNCPQKCHEFILGAVTGSSRWPTENHRPRVCELVKAHADQVAVANAARAHPDNYTYPEGPEGFTSVKDCTTWFRKNTLLTQVYFESMTYRELVESPSYQILDAIGTFGGQLGLWQGASVITMIEFVAFLMIVVAYFWAKCLGPKRKHVSNADDDLLDEDMFEEKKTSSSSSSGEDSEEKKSDSDSDASSPSSSSSSSSSNSSSDTDGIYGETGTTPPPKPVSAAPI